MNFLFILFLNRKCIMALMRWFFILFLFLRYVTFILEFGGVPVGNLSGIRTFRVLRAFKTISVIPGEFVISVSVFFISVSSFTSENRFSCCKLLINQKDKWYNCTRWPDFSSTGELLTNKTLLETTTLCYCSSKERVNISPTNLNQGRGFFSNHLRTLLCERGIFSVTIFLQL